MKILTLLLLAFLVGCENQPATVTPPPPPPIQQPAKPVPLPHVGKLREGDIIVRHCTATSHTTADGSVNCICRHPKIELDANDKTKYTQICR